MSTRLFTRDKFSDQLTIQCIPLDDIVSVPDEVLSIKFDVEGHELQAIAGDRNLLGQNRVLIQDENHAPGDVWLADFLNGLVYRRLLNIGPDRYLSNVPDLGETQIISASSRASSNMIRSSLSRGGIELSETAAKLARRLKRSLRRS